MKTKGQLAPLVIMFIGIAIAVVVAGTLMVPQAYSPQAPVETAVTNSTALNNLNSTPFKSQTFATSNVDNTHTSKIVVTYQLGTGKEINVTVSGTSIGNLSGTSPQTLTIPSAITLANPTVVNFTYLGVSTAGVNATNITSAVFTYNQKGSYYGWDAGPQALWLVIPLALVALLLIFIFSGGKR